MSFLLNILVPILAVILVYKLYTTLGKDDDDNQDNQNNNRINDEQQKRHEQLRGSSNGDNVINLPTSGKKDKNTSRPDPVEVLANAMDSENFANADDIAKDGLKNVIIAHPSFNYREFMNGAEVAYEMINIGFAENDRDILQKLLTASVYESFNTVMSAREAAGNRVHSRFVGYERVQLKTASVDGDMVTLAVHFTAKLVSTTYDKNDHIIEGNEKHIYNTNDIWTFENNMNDDNTTWQLCSTAKG